MKLRNLFFIFLFVSCANRSLLNEEPQIRDKPLGFTNPNQKIEVEILMDKTEGSEPTSALTKGKLKAGAIVPQHTHTDSDEYLYFVKGAGELTINGKTHFVQDNQTYYIPRGIEHSYVNRSSKDAEFFQVYTPGGPEQRFKKWSRLGVGQ